jgi:hypothetical protein
MTLVDEGFEFHYQLNSFCLIKRKGLHALRTLFIKDSRLISQQFYFYVVVFFLVYLSKEKNAWLSSLFNHFPSNSSGPYLSWRTLGTEKWRFLYYWIIRTTTFFCFFLQKNITITSLFRFKHLLLFAVAALQKNVFKVIFWIKIFWTIFLVAPPLKLLSFNLLSD